MERGDKVVVTNPDSCFRNRKGKVAQVRPAKEVVFVDVIIKGRKITFNQKDLERRELD